MIEEEAEFVWNEAVLREVATKLGSQAKPSTSWADLEIGNVRLPTRRASLVGADITVIDTVRQWMSCLSNGAYSSILTYDGNSMETSETQRNESSWLKFWRQLAAKLKISYINLTNKSTDAVIYRPIHVIPHLVTVLAIANVNVDDVVIVYGRHPKGKDEVPLRTVLRHFYANVPSGDLQALHFLSKGLLDIYSLVFSRAITAEFSTDDFFCDSSLWIHYDLFNPLFRAFEQRNPMCQVSLQEATNRWVRREWTNYEYLIYLNDKAGRVRGQVHNHPIFPWVCDFTSEDGGWRPLNRTKYRLAKGDDQLREMFSRVPSHHVPELLSDIGYMMYRARIETKENLCKHVRSKWVPEEYPSSVRRMYECTPDECIPELFEDPQIFVSRHADMSDIELPKFVDDPQGFIDWHRKMLESEEVSRNLHRWIDLVFGYLLSEEDATKSLNVHLCFVEKNGRQLRTSGMVKLFDRPHSERCQTNYDPSTDFYADYLNTVGNAPKRIEESFESNLEAKEEEIDDLLTIYKKLKLKHRENNRRYFYSMLSVLRLLAQFAVAEHLHGSFDDDDYIRKCIRHHAYSIPTNYRTLFELFLDPGQDFPDPDEFAFFVNVQLNIPIEISQFHDEFAKFVSYNNLRNFVIVPKNSKRSQSILVREVESLKTSIKCCHNMERCVVAAFRKLLENEEASIQAVHRLMSIVTRNLSDESLKDLILPLVDLIQCETSVKLLDRRFLLSVSIAYGAHTFLDIFLPLIVEALASRQVDRSIVAKDSIMWLTKRYGPVVCAKFISSNLLRILASCYEGFELDSIDQEPKSVFTVPLKGDDYGNRVETALSEIVITYSVTFVTVQYLPFCADLVEQYSRRTSTQLEPALVSVFRIIQISVKTMTDHQLMNYLEDYVINKIIHRVLVLVLNSDISFSSTRVRNIILCRAITLLRFISQRIGAENVRLYAKMPFELLFTTFAQIYETDDELKVTLKQTTRTDCMYNVPLWIVHDMIDKFASEWGVPFLSSFCPDPAFLVPFVSKSVPNLQTSPVTLTTYTMNSIPSGNRLFSLSTSSSFSSPPSLGGLSSLESGALSAVWCARVSAAVCGTKTALRFDHLSLCSFSGHSGSIKRIAAISNENSFVSASSDKTVKLWSVKPEQDSVECQWTYRGHNKSLNDVIILSDNAIASTDGVLHVWDPFRSSVLAQLDWDSEGTIISLDTVDRHTVAAISSLHSTVKLFDTRVGSWTSSLKVSPHAGVTRAISCIDSGHKMAVALSNGTIVILDARTGKLASLAHGNASHTNDMKWLNRNELLVCDADDAAVVMSVKNRLQVSRRLNDTVTAAGIQNNMIATIQSNSVLRIYTGADLTIETKIRSDELPGQPTAILPLALNSTFLLGSSQGAIRLMC